MDFLESIGGTKQAIMSLIQGTMHNTKKKTAFKQVPYLLSIFKMNHIDWVVDWKVNNNKSSGYILLMVSPIFADPPYCTERRSFEYHKQLFQLLCLYIVSGSFSNVHVCLCTTNIIRKPVGSSD